MAISSVIVDKIEELSGIFVEWVSRYIDKEFISRKSTPLPP
jgi:hypothetical protein